MFIFRVEKSFLDFLVPSSTCQLPLAFNIRRQYNSIPLEWFPPLSLFSSLNPPLSSQVAFWADICCCSLVGKPKILSKFSISENRHRKKYTMFSVDEIFHNNFNDWPVFIAKFIRDLTFYRKSRDLSLKKSNTQSWDQPSEVGPAEWKVEKGAHELQLLSSSSDSHSIRASTHVHPSIRDFSFSEIRVEILIFHFIFCHVLIAFCSISPPRILRDMSLCIINVKFCVSKRDFMVCQFRWNKFIHVNFRLQCELCTRSHENVRIHSSYVEGLFKIEKRH